MSVGDFPESLSQAMLLGIMLVGRLGVLLAEPGLLPAALNMCVYIYIYIYIYMYICICVCVYIYIYIYVCTAITTTSSFDPSPGHAAHWQKLLSSP